MAQRFDLHIQTLSEKEQLAGLKILSFGYKNTLGVKGFQMLINQWLKCLLTRKGTDPTDLDYGTQFVALTASQVSYVDAQDVVRLAIDQCNVQVTRMNRRDTSLTATERLASAELTAFEERPSDPGFSVTVEIRNQAQERLALNLPVHTASI